MKFLADSIFFSPIEPSAKAEADFFARLKMRNGTFKMTRPSRFQDWEERLLPFLRARRGGLEDVLDIGVSTGVTTVEFAEHLRRHGFDARFTATDLFIDAFLVRLGRHAQVLCDGDGWPLRYELFGLSMRPWTRRLDYLTMAFLPLAIARKRLQPRLAQAIRAGRARRVQMTTRLPQARSIEFIQNDIMQRTPALEGRFELVRAANILNVGYFSADEIAQALGNIRSYLAGSGSLLLVTRTGEAKGNNGTLFELGDDDRFHILDRVGQGSEVESHVLGLAPKVISLDTHRRRVG